MRSSGASIADLQFGYALASSDMTTGILGVCYGVEITGYYCVIDQMYLQGIIASRTFALDLGSVDSATGSDPHFGASPLLSDTRLNYLWRD